MAAAVGLFPGLALGSLVQQADLDPTGVWIGAMFVEVILIGIAGLLWVRWGMGRAERGGAWALVGAAVGWFGYRWMI